MDQKSGSKTTDRGICRGHTQASGESPPTRGGVSPLLWPPRNAAGRAPAVSPTASEHRLSFLPTLRLWGAAGCGHTWLWFDWPRLGWWERLCLDGHLSPFPEPSGVLRHLHYYPWVLNNGVGRGRRSYSPSWKHCSLSVRRAFHSTFSVSSSRWKPRCHIRSTCRRRRIKPFQPYLRLVTVPSIRRTIRPPIPWQVRDDFLSLAIRKHHPHWLFCRALDLLFKFFTSWCLRIVPALFLRDMYRALSVPPSQTPPKTPHYSPMLHNALVALALAFLDDPKFTDLKSRQYFANTAKSFIEAECQKPNLSVVHALSVLSSFHSSQGDQTLGYLYFGLTSAFLGRRDADTQLSLV